MSNTLKAGICGAEYSPLVLELTRLCVEDNAEPNSRSFLIARSFELLPKPVILVSYADTGQNHVGYIYQATNWIYTGMSAGFKDVRVRGFENMHHASVEDSVFRGDDTDKPDSTKLEALTARYGADNIYYEERSRKHRYIMFLGDKRFKRKMMASLKYPVLPYPKGESLRYDASQVIDK